MVGAIDSNNDPTMSRWCSNQLSYAPEEAKVYQRGDIVSVRERGNPIDTTRSVTQHAPRSEQDSRRVHGGA